MCFFSFVPSSQTLSTSGFLSVSGFHSLARSRSSLSLPGHSAIHLEEANTANAISLHSPLLCLSLPFISAESRDLFVCATSFCPCQSTGRAIYEPLPIVCEQIRTS